MGIRALLERLMIERVQDQGSFSGNLNAFERAGYIQQDGYAGVAAANYKKFLSGKTLPLRCGEKMSGNVVFAPGLCRAAIHQIGVLVS